MRTDGLWIETVNYGGKVRRAELHRIIRGRKSRPEADRRVGEEREAARGSTTLKATCVSKGL